MIIFVPMHIRFNNKIVFLTVALAALSACNISKRVPDGSYLLVENSVLVDDKTINSDELFEVIKQKRNTGLSLKMKFRLRIFNSIRDKKITKSINRRLAKYRRKNKNKLARELRINTKRYKRALAKSQKGDFQENGKMVEPSYRPKVIELKDTVNLGSTFRQTLKNKVGQKPVIIDTTLVTSSVRQLEKYMRSKGYFNSKVDFSINTTYKNLFKKSKRAWVIYSVKAGPRKIIDSIFLNSDSREFDVEFERFLRKNENNLFAQKLKDAIFKNKSVSLPYDADMLDAMRYQLATNMRNRTYFGFSESFVSYYIDTSRHENKASLYMKVSKRPVTNEKGEIIRYIEHPSARIYQVNYHLLDSSQINDSINFSEYVNFRDKNRVSLLSEGNLVTMDTSYFDQMTHKKEDFSASKIKGETVYFKSRVHKNLLGQYKDSIGINSNRCAYFYYNKSIFVNPVLIEAQNFLENDNYYKAYYFDRSSSWMNSLGLFSSVKIKVNETEPGKLKIDYYLVPAKRQSFIFQPKATNSSGFLGVSAQVGYTNLNVRKTGTSFNISLQGGFEANPRVLDNQNESSENSTGGFRLNTIDVNIPVKFEIPGLFPVKIDRFKGKRQRPKTILSFGAGYQLRPEFSRVLAQVNYLFKSTPTKTQSLLLGFPTFSSFKFVSISNETVDFLNQINSGGDLFLKNAYSDQFIWEDGKIEWKFDNTQADNRGKTLMNFTATGTSAGLILSALTNLNPKLNSDGVRTLFNVPYSQFWVTDFKFVSNTEYKKHKFFSQRIQFSYGRPYGNSKTSLPYDYSFFGGGSNDNRGWVARTLGPGNYNAALDTNANLTQIGDVRVSGSVEWRIGNGGYFNHAFFVDYGNLWTVKPDANRPGTQFGVDFVKDIAISAGYGLRFDLSFFVLRFDFAFPIHDPSFVGKEQWIFVTDKQNFKNDAAAVFGSDLTKLRYRQWWQPQFQFGIGYPF
jgi:outer membrane protein insertion porin family